jgi:hypothetical protein
VSRVGRKLLWWIAVPLAAIAVLGLSLPFILRSIDYKALLAWQLENQLNRKVELGNAQVDFFPHVRIALEGIVVRDVNSPDPFMAADRLFVDLRIFPLLARKVMVKRVILNRPILRITRGPDGKLNISDLFTSAQGAVTIPLLGQEITIVDGRISFTEMFRTDVIRTLTIEHLYTTVRSGPREITAKLSARIPHEKGESTISLNAKMPAQATTEGKQAERGDGQLEARNLNLGQLAPFLESRSLVVGGHGIVDLTTGFEYRAGREEDSLTLKALRLNVAGTAITGSGVVKGILSKPAGFNASLTTTPFRLESLISSLPEDMLSDHGLGFLRTSEVGGPVRLVSLRVSGNPDGEQPVIVQGEVEVLGAHAVIGSNRVPLSEVRGLLRVDTDRIVIERLTGKYGEAEVTAGRGEITQLTERPELYLAAKGAVSAQELATIVTRFAPPPVLPSGPKGLSGLAGAAEARVLLAGPLAQLDDLRVEWELDARDIGFTDPRVPLPVTIGSGRVHSIHHGIAFEQITGTFGKVALTANGDIRYPPGDKIAYDFSAAGQGNAKDLGGVLGAPLPESSALQGVVGFNARLSGLEDQLRGTASMDLTQVGIAVTPGWGKPEGVPADLQFSLLLNPGHRVKIERMLLGIPPLTVFASGMVSLEEGRQFLVHVRVPSVAFRALPKGLLGSDLVLTGGSLQGEITVDGNVDNWRTANIRGRASVKNAGFKMERLEHAIDDLNLDVAFQDNRIDLERVGVKIENSRINGKATVRGWRGVPVVEVALDSPGMDLDLLIPKGERSPIRTALELITGSAKLSGAASIRHGAYKGIDFEQIRAKLSGGNNKLIVDSINGTLPVGVVTGQVTLGLLPEKPITVESSLILDEVPVVPFFHAFGIKDPPVTGALSMKANVRGETGTYNTLNGEANLIIEKGYFQRLSATSKIIGILNLPTLLAGKVDFSNKGMPFDCLSSRVAVKNGLAKVERYVVDSPIMKMTAAGEYDIPNNSTNMVMAVSPLGSYEEFLKGLPVFGKLFIGERQELVTAFYEVKGPLEDPKVKLLPMRSVTSGVGAVAEMALDVMKNVFLLPKELLAPSKKQSSPCADF